MIFAVEVVQGSVVVLSRCYSLSLGLLYIFGYVFRSPRFGFGPFHSCNSPGGQK